MTDAAIATADRVCGVYRLVAMDWTGDPVDLDGDGIARSLWEECLSGDNLGVEIPETGEIDMTVNPIVYGQTWPTSFNFLMFQGDFTPGEERWIYSLVMVPSEYDILPDGTFSLYVPSEYRESQRMPDNKVFGIRDISASWEADGDFLISGTTTFYDLLNKQSVEGRETLRFHCISTKERKK